MWHRTVTVSILVLLTLLACPVAVAAQPVLGDINGDGAVNATDVQLVINEALGISTGFDCDINRSGAVDATDVQVLINGALGIPIGGPVPDVVDLTRAAAETAITSAGFLVGTVTEANSDTVPTGNVISQIPAGGSLAVTGAAISLTVSLGPGIQTETILLPGNVPLELVWIPAGTFMMGRYPGEQDSYDLEDPQHQVTLTQGFWLGKYEVTKRQWQAVMGTTPWLGQVHVLSDLDSPAVYVSWNDAQAFIAAVNALGQGTVRLPTEAQWEYACRAGATTRFYWGDDPTYAAINDYAWWYGNAYYAGEYYAHVVGLKLPNAWGLCDMSGNVWEWCQDWYGGYPSASVTDPTGPSSGSDRVLRGGGWGYVGTFCRSAYRTYFPLSTRSDVGFRLAR